MKIREIRKASFGGMAEGVVFSWEGMYYIKTQQGMAVNLRSGEMVDFNNHQEVTPHPDAEVVL